MSCLRLPAFLTSESFRRKSDDFTQEIEMLITRLLVVKDKENKDKDKEKIVHACRCLLCYSRECAAAEHVPPTGTQWQL